MQHSEKRKVSRVLIANRGEIARRVIRACDEMGIETVAVYSDVDEHLPHVHEATLREAIGGPNSYLSIEAIVSAAMKSGADSVHPGYGFLSENPLLQEALAKHNITFIGPNAQSIRALGSKTGAKHLAAAVNVPVAPTLLLNSGDITEKEKLLRDFGDQVGYPVLVKAAAGGGGRGMRLITASSDFKHELESAAREALKAFGSAEVFVEKYIPVARHIEVQIAGDLHGGVVALGTRDCSLQRSNQKMIEEAPATGLKTGVTEELYEAACRLAKASAYSNVGTVEFLYTPEGLFYFLEVNTRLQVEHPVTELVTGIDLVKLQIELARGKSLQELLPNGVAPQPKGHAIEARLCAEEYVGRFVSATGVILEQEILKVSELPGVIRVDMGYEPCSEVSHYYDSLIGKIIVHSESRSGAIKLLHDTLSRSRISGVGTNRSLLIHLLSQEEFRAQQHSIQGTQNLLPSTEELKRLECEAFSIAAAVRLYERRSSWCASSPWLSEASELRQDVRFPFAALIRGELHTSEAWFSDSGVTVQVTSPHGSLLSIRVFSQRRGEHGFIEAMVSVDDRSPIPVHLLTDGPSIWIHTPDATHTATESHAQPRSQSTGAQSSELRISSPLPGKVVTVGLKPGQEVSEGEVLLVLDSMKMEHPVRAPRNATVASVSVSQGSIVQAGAVLVVLT